MRDSPVHTDILGSVTVLGNGEAGNPVFLLCRVPDGICRSGSEQFEAMHVKLRIKLHAPILGQALGGYANVALLVKETS